MLRNAKEVAQSISIVKELLGNKSSEVEKLVSKVGKAVQTAFTSAIIVQKEHEEQLVYNQKKKQKKSKKQHRIEGDETMTMAKVKRMVNKKQYT